MMTQAGRLNALLVKMIVILKGVVKKKIIKFYTT